MREYYVDIESPYVIEIYAKDKESIITFLNQHDRAYVCENIQIVSAFNGFHVMFIEYNDKFWTEFPYWKLDSDIKLTMYDVDTVHILTQKEHMKEDNKDLLKWANIYTYTLTGNLEEDLFQMYKLFTIDDEFHHIEESDFPKVKACVLETYLEIIEPNNMQGKRERRRFSELKFHCS